MSQPVKIFIAYSRKDSEMLDELRAHMNALLLSKKVEKIWCDKHIEPAAFWEEEIEKELNTANIILLLLSADALNSDYFVHKEMPAALKRHYEGKAEVIPIILRACAWQGLPIAKIQAFPRSGKAIDSHIKRDEAYTEVVKEIASKLEPRSLEDMVEIVRGYHEDKSLGKNDLDSFFNMILRSLNPSRDISLQLNSQRDIFNETFQKEYVGTISDADAKKKYAEIIRVIKQLAKKIEKEDFSRNNSENSPLDDLAKSLHLKSPPTLLSLVNCDRIEPQNKFFDHFRENRNRSSSQFFFLSTCPTQKPKSFTERLIYELEATDKKVSYNTDTTNGRFEPDALPYSPYDLNECQNKLIKYFMTRFQRSNNKQSFEELLEVNNDSWDYIVTAFEITTNEWNEKITPAYLNWIINKFSQAKSSSTKFIFFFLFSIKNVHREDIKLQGMSQKAYQGFRKMLGLERENNKPLNIFHNLLYKKKLQPSIPENTTLIQPLLPVHCDDFEYWLETIGDDVQQHQKDRIIELMAKSLQGEEAAWYRKKKEFNMETIERFQNKVYQFHKYK